jgi:hypothetical protein
MQCDMRQFGGCKCVVMHDTGARQSSRRWRPCSRPPTTTAPRPHLSPQGAVHTACSVGSR